MGFLKDRWWVLHYFTFLHIAEGEGVLQIYAEDTLYATAASLDKEAEKLNTILEKLYDWFCRNLEVL